MKMLSKILALAASLLTTIASAQTAPNNLVLYWNLSASAGASGAISTSVQARIAAACPATSYKTYFGVEGGAPLMLHGDIQVGGSVSDANALCIVGVPSKLRLYPTSALGGSIVQLSSSDTSNTALSPVNRDYTRLGWSGETLRIRLAVVSIILPDNKKIIIGATHNIILTGSNTGAGRYAITASWVISDVVANQGSNGGEQILPYFRQFVNGEPALFVNTAVTVSNGGSPWTPLPSYLIPVHAPPGYVIGY